VSQVQPLDLLRKAIATAQTGDKAQTRRLLREVTTLDPGNEVAWMWLASVGESALEALEYLERALEINPTNERARDGVKSARMQASLDAVRAKNKPLARRLLTQVARDQPNNEAVWLNLAGVADVPGEAIGYLERVLQLNPANERARAGIVYYRARLTQPANPTWECPLCQVQAEARPERCPRCGAVLTLADPEAFPTNAVVDKQQLRGAIERHTTRLRHQPDYLGHFHLGLAHLNLNQFDEAITQFQAAWRLKPDERTLRSQITALMQRKAARDRAAREAAPQRVVLIVDDSPTIRKLVTMTLENGGHRVVAAADGQEAVDCICSKGVPDLILLDITMPGMDGYQLCKLLRQSRETQNVPIVMLSGKDGFFSKIRGRMAGSTEYITKPFRPEALLRLMEKYCGAGPQLKPAGSVKG
jgi:twitching motility two-component system response regulator PilG